VRDEVHFGLLNDAEVVCSAKGLRRLEASLDELFDFHLLRHGKKRNDEPNCSLWKPFSAHLDRIVPPFTRH
jgi:hypothetical protein